MNKLSVAFQLLAWFLPWVIRRMFLVRVLGFRISSKARIGCSIILCDNFSMDEGSRIGHLTVAKGLEFLELEACAKIGNLNWITGQARAGGHFEEQKDRLSTLKVERHAAITHRHLIDCTDAVRIGAFSTVAGWGSQILTHGIDINESRQRSAPVSIGSYCFLGTRSVVLKGSVLPDYSILAPGAVLNNKFDQNYTLYGGVPARAVKEVDASAAYFHRVRGFVL